MVVNMACVPNPESGTKVLKMTPPWHGSSDIDLTSEKQKQQQLIMHEITNIPGRNWILKTATSNNIIQGVSKKKVIELWRAIGHSIFNIQK